MKLLKLLKPLVKPSPVIGPGGKNVQMNDIRTSHQVFLSDKYPVVQDIYNKLSNIIGIDKIIILNNYKLLDIILDNCIKNIGMLVGKKINVKIL